MDTRLHRVDRDTVGGDLEGERLQERGRAGARRVRQDDVRDRLTNRHRRDRDDSAPAALLHPRHGGLAHGDDRHQVQVERIRDRRRPVSRRTCRLAVRRRSGRGCRVVRRAPRRPPRRTRCRPRPIRHRTRSPLRRGRPRRPLDRDGRDRGRRSRRGAPSAASALAAPRPSPDDPAATAARRRSIPRSMRRRYAWTWSAPRSTAVRPVTDPDTAFVLHDEPVLGRGVDRDAATGPAAWTANSSGSHHMLAITYSPGRCQAIERECGARSGPPDAPNHSTSFAHHSSCVEHRMVGPERDHRAGRTPRARSTRHDDPSRSTTSRCPGCRRCCSRPASVRTRHRRRTSACRG